MIAFAERFHCLLKCLHLVLVPFFSMQLWKQSLSPLGAGIIGLLHMRQALCEAASVGSATAAPKKVLSDSLKAELIYVFRCELDIV